MGLDGHVAIITGSTRGIGYSIAKQLVLQGASVVINGRTIEQVEETIFQLQSMGGKVVGIAKPVEFSDTGEELINLALKKFGKVNSLINNAGIVYDKMSDKMNDHEFSKVIDVHVKGTFYCSRAFVRELKKQGIGGHIINMTSTAGLEGTIGQANYSAAKAAINGLTWSLAKELKKYDVQVNAIAPAALTDMTRPYVEKAERKAAEKGLTLPHYWEIGSPDEVANFVLELIAQPDIKETGTIYGVNGQNIGKWHPPVFEPFSKKG